MIGTIVTGIAYAVGALVFYLCARQRQFSARITGWLLVAGLGGGIIGAKSMRFMFATASGASLLAIAAHPDGRTIIGGVLGGWVAVELAKKKLHINRSTGDCFALALPIGEAIGRVGCFLNGCCGGAACHLPWSVYQQGQWRHPAQIYSMFACLAIFAVILWLRKRTKREGELFRWYLILWAGSRFLLEFVRERTDVYYGLSLAQWICIELAATMAAAMLWRHRVRLKQGKDNEGNTAEAGVEA